MLKAAIRLRVLDPALAAMLDIGGGIVVLVHAVLAVVFQAAIQLRVAHGAAMAMRG
jgi:hypothetical protein